MIPARPTPPCLLALALLAAACGGTEAPPAAADASTPAVPESACLDNQDEDGDGKTDCDDSDCAGQSACKPVSCDTQYKCGDIVEDVVTPCCLGGLCVPPGPRTPQGKAVTSPVNFALSFQSPMVGASTPGSVVIRFLHPDKLSGGLVSCSALRAASGCKENKPLTFDAATDFNQVFRFVYEINSCSQSPCKMPSNPSPPSNPVPRGESYVLYAEAWNGKPDSTGNNPTGTCAATACIEGQSVLSDGASFPLETWQPAR